MLSIKQIRDELNTPEYNRTKFAFDVSRAVILGGIATATGWGLTAYWASKAAPYVAGMLTTHIPAVANMFYPKAEAKFTQGPSVESPSVNDEENNVGADEATPLVSKANAEPSRKETGCEKAARHIKDFVPIAAGFAFGGFAGNLLQGAAPSVAAAGTAAVQAGVSSILSTVTSRAASVSFFKRASSAVNGTATSQHAATLNA